MQWKILEIDKTTGKPTKLISEKETDESLRLSGSNGYNNAVYLLNKACETLYSKTGIGTARSIKIEDLEENYKEDGKKAKIEYSGSAIKYGNKYNTIRWRRKKSIKNKWTR